MKKIMIVLLTLLVVMSTATRQASADEPLAGGWTPAADYTVTEDLQAIFDKGMEMLLGVDYVPLAYLGSQVVAGTNHVFLVKGTVVVPNAPVSYGLAYFYQDLQGNVTLMTLADLPIVPQEDDTLALTEEGRLVLRCGSRSYRGDPDPPRQGPGGPCGRILRARGEPW